MQTTSIRPQADDLSDLTPPLHRQELAPDRPRADSRAGRVQATASAVLVAAIAAVAIGTGGIGDASAQGAGAEWASPAGSLEGTRYSTLTQIDRGNVAGLVEEFSITTGSRATHEGNPLVVGSTLYLVTPFPNRLIAVDLARNGAIKWTFSPRVTEYARGVACCDVVNRGAAYGAGKIVYNTLDNTTVAVDAVTGKQVWAAKLGDPRTGQTLTGAPIVVGSKVIVGNAGGELGVRGWVTALDLATGQQAWRAYTTGPDADVLIKSGFKPFYAKDQGTDLGVSTWPTNLWKQGGSTAWGWLTYDPEMNLLFYGTGNPGVWNPDMRPGDNKWGSTIFARNPDTGAAVWAYQVTPHDGWDFDAVNESVAVTLTMTGGPRKVLVHFNKNGFAYTFDRATGEVLVAKPFGTVNWASSVNTATGLPAVDPAKMTKQGVVTPNVCPSALGVKDWEPSAFSPTTGLFYIPAINFCNDYEALKAIYIAGTPFMGADLSFVPGPGGFLGEMIAWNAATGTRAWSIQEPLPVYAGVLATAGNLVFYGTLDKKFKAVDATTGAVLFQTTLECGVVSNPITFMGPDNKQRVAIMTGVGWLAGGFAGGTCPAQTGEGGGEVEDDPPATRAGKASGTPSSGALHVFKLP